MFGWFRKRPEPSGIRPEADVVYLDANATLDAVASALKARPGERAVVLVPFRGAIASVAEGLARRAVQTAVIERSTRDAGSAPGAVALLSYDDVEMFLGASRGPFRVLQIGRYPLRARDLEVEMAFAAHTNASRLRVYLSIDEGLLALFDPDRKVRAMCETLGLTPGEPIQHEWVTRSIENAQAKIAKRVKTEVPASDFSAWVSANMK
jgi:hypothetical protein